MCIVEKLALNFMYSLYKNDNRYLIDPNEEKRIKYIDINDKRNINEEHLQKK